MNDKSTAQTEKPTEDPRPVVQRRLVPVDLAPDEPWKTPFYESVECEGDGRGQEGR